MPYLDHNATAPFHPAARSVWLETVEQAWHNPGGLYPAATAARELLEACRERLADLLDCDPARVIFTSGATEGANAVARHLRATAEHGTILISPLEHPCVDEAFHGLLGPRVELLPVTAAGVVAWETVLPRLHTGRRPALISVMAASNESGVLQPWRTIAETSRSAGVAFHTDASQWIGRLPAAGLGECDWVTASAHKCGGPRGVGFMLVPAGIKALHAAWGGPQERGRRAGTEDVAGIAALVAAIESAEASLSTVVAEDRAGPRDRAWNRLRDGLPGAVLVSGAAERLWNTLAVVVPGADSRRLVAALGRAGVAASTGSACASGAGSTPRILAAIGAERLGLSPRDLRGMVRFSSGHATTDADWETAVDALVSACGDELPPPRVSLHG